MSELRSFPMDCIVTLSDYEIDRLLQEENLKLFISSESVSGYYYVQTYDHYFTVQKYFKHKFGTARTAAFYLSRHITPKPWLHPEKKAMNSQSIAGSPRNRCHAKKTEQNVVQYHEIITMSEEEAAECIATEHLDILANPSSKSGYRGVVQPSKSNYWVYQYKQNKKTRHSTERFGTPLLAAINYARLIKKRPDLHPLHNMIKTIEKNKNSSKSVTKIPDEEVDAIALKEGLTLIQSDDNLTGYRGVTYFYAGRKRYYKAGFRLTKDGKRDSTPTLSKAVGTARMAALEYARLVALDAK
jgi:hypothetical protein